MSEKTELKITSPAFKNDSEIPSRYTCDGEGISSALRINNILEGAETLALIVEDPDAPNGVFDHWIVWDIDQVTTINEHSLPGTSGDNSAGKSGYHPPCPPSGSNRYTLKVYALNTFLDLLAGVRKNDLQTAMEGHIMGEGSLTGRYERKK